MIELNYRTCLKTRLIAYFHKFRRKMERKCSIFVRFSFYYNMIFLFRSHYFFSKPFRLIGYENKQPNQNMSIVTIYFYALLQILGLNACRKLSWQALNDSSIVWHYYQEARWKLWLIKLKIISRYWIATIAHALWLDAERGKFFSLWPGIICEICPRDINKVITTKKSPWLKISMQCPHSWLIRSS